jgi:hypothetical protein
MRRWEPHDPGRSCLFHTIAQYVTKQTNSQNDGALRQLQRSVIAFISGTRIALTSDIFLPKGTAFSNGLITA